MSNCTVRKGWNLMLPLTQLFMNKFNAIEDTFGWFSWILKIFVCVKWLSTEYIYLDSKIQSGINRIMKDHHM